jgi:hypothetical protein
MIIEDLLRDADRLCGLVWPQTQRSRVRFQSLPDFLSSSWSGRGPTQPL